MPDDHSSLLIGTESSFFALELSKEDHWGMIDSCLAQLDELAMKHSAKDKMFQLCSKIVKQISNLTKEVVQQNNGFSALNVIDATTCLISSKIESFHTRYKREKRIAKNKFYVAPQERAVGTRIELLYDKIEQIERPHLIQSTLQIVSIISTLKSFFNRAENFEMYLKFQKEHRCEENVYKHFCCGQVYKSQAFFSENPNAIQLQLAIDDVEICDPLSSKSNMHKISAVYLVIKNIPPRFNSKLNNIFLVCLCNVDDLKTKKTDINNIWEMIVSEIKFLEENGIVLDNGMVLKGTLVNVTADNLGANNALCLTESFRSHYYCRVCTMKSDECKNATSDDLNKYRNKSHYEKMLQIVRDSEIVNLKETCGIKRYCVLDDLKYFSIFINFSLDIMHDLNEGVVSFLLTKVFLFFLEMKVLTETQLKDTVKFYQYPKYFRRDKPSILNFNRHNLGQNASQMRCLFLNIPFILSKYEQNVHVKKVWPCLTYLLRVFQIVHSEFIDEPLLRDLEECVSNHLKLIKELFKVDLIPKHHFMTHYGNVIRQMGPLVHMSMMRFEAKHTFFKNVARHTNNFVNINKTLATKAQQHSASSENTFCDKITHSKEKPVNIEFIKSHFDPPILSHVLNSSNCYELNSFSFNAYKYERRSILSHQKCLYEIEMILLTDTQFFFVAKKMDLLGNHAFSQSIEVNKPESQNYSLIAFEKLLHKKPYSCKFIDARQFVIVDSKDILRI